MIFFVDFLKLHFCGIVLTVSEIYVQKLYLSLNRDISANNFLFLI